MKKILLLLNVFAFMVLITNPKILGYGWGFSRNDQHLTPEIGFYKQEIEGTNSYFVGDTSQKEVYLTFDAGYDHGILSKILDILKDKNVKSTFFVTGDFLTREQDLVKRIVDEGHIVGNHTWNHKNITKISLDTLEEEITKVEDKYYNSKNAEVSWKEYTLDCFPTKCQKVCNPKKGDECFYLDNSGKETTEIKYLQECETHICEQVGDLYYDINGDVVTKEAMDKSCADAIVCDYKDGNYYDENGNITTKENYELKCLKHSCEKIGDTYFDKDGNVVDADTYDRSCNPKIENPKTGWTVPLLSLFLLLGIGLIVYRETKKHSKFM